MPTNNDAFKSISSEIEDDSSTKNEGSLVEVNKIYVTIWLKDNKRNWHLGYCTSCYTDKIVIDHLQRVRKNGHCYWKHTEVSDSAQVMVDQILKVRPIGQWVHKSARNMVSELQNINVITDAVREIQDN